MGSTARGGEPQRFSGAAGTTRMAGTSVWCPGCDTWYGARYHLSIDAARDPELLVSFRQKGFVGLNRVACPACGATYVAEEPLTIHDPVRQRLVLVLPPGQRHRGQQHRAALLLAVAEDAGSVLPEYALAPVLAVGPEGLEAVLPADEPMVFVTRTAPRPDVTAPVPAAPARAPEPVAATTVEEDLPFDPDAPEISQPPQPSLWKPEPVAAASSIHSSVDPAAIDIDQRPVPATIGEAAELPADVASDPGAVSIDLGEGVPEAVVEPGAAIDLASPEDSVEQTGERAGAVRVEAPAELSVDLSMESVERPSALPPPPAPPTTQVKPRPDPAGRRRPGLLSELLGAAGPTPPPLPAERSGESWDPAIDAGWSLEAAESAETEEPTHVVRADTLEPPARRSTGPVFDPERAGGRDAYLRVEGERVLAVMKMPAERARAFGDGDVDVWFQLQQPPAGPVLALVLVRRTLGEVEDHAWWIVEHESPDHAAVLDRLEKSFAVELQLHGPDGAFVARRLVRAPREANVRAARDAIAGMESARGKALDRAAARRQYAEASFDRVGRLRHNFQADSFADLPTPSAARLALGILAYWSAPERRDYLLRVKSFPLPWFEQMSARVLSAALELGLATEPHLRQRALDLGLAESSVALVRRSLANFAEVSLNLKPNDLDPIEAWENWDALLAHAEELEIRVDEEIEELAALSMERAREAAQQGESLELSADDGSIELEEVADLGDLGAADLVALLDDRAHRLDAVLGLLHKGEPVYVPAVFDALKRMRRDELQRAVPAALAMGPAFELHFLGALRSRKASLRLAAALFLAEIRSERAAPQLLAQIPEANEPEWPILARAAARMGRRILAPAVKQVEAEGDPGDRIAFALALLGPEARGALSAALDRERSELVRAALRRAIERTGEVSFGDAADFTERLADAFAAAGPDALGPDFEEDLESIDIGPAASVQDLEAEVDLGGLDDPRGK